MLLICGQNATTKPLGIFFGLDQSEQQPGQRDHSLAQKLSEVKKPFLQRDTACRHTLFYRIHLTTLLRLPVFSICSFVATLLSSKFIGSYFSNCICSRHTPVSHFGNSHNMSHYFCHCYIGSGDLWLVIFWYYYCDSLKAPMMFTFFSKRCIFQT